jgi:hypothetical protein
MHGLFIKGLLTDVSKVRIKKLYCFHSEEGFERIFACSNNYRAELPLLKFGSF